MAEGSQEEPLPPGAEEEKEESSDKTPVPQEEEAPDQTSQQPNIPKISFRVRKEV